MARSASLGVERSTKAYPTGRSVRGFFGMEVDSLKGPHVSKFFKPRIQAFCRSYVLDRGCRRYLLGPRGKLLMTPHLPEQNRAMIMGPLS